MICFFKKYKDSVIILFVLPFSTLLPFLGAKIIPHHRHIPSKRTNIRHPASYQPFEPKTDDSLHTSTISVHCSCAQFVSIGLPQFCAIFSGRNNGRNGCDGLIGRDQNFLFLMFYRRLFRINLILRWNRSRLREHKFPNSFWTSYGSLPCDPKYIHTDKKNWKCI